MITILFGDNTKQSREYLRSLVDQKDTVSIPVQDVTITDMKQVLDGTPLFSEKRTVILEEFLSKAKKSKEKDAIISYLESKAYEHDIILWEGKDLPKTSFRGFSKPVLKQFKPPQTLFQFLDGVLPHNTAYLISLHHQTLANTEPELIFFMLVRHIRILLALSNPSDAPIDELKRLAPWQVTKLQKQAKSLGQDRLLDLHTKLFILEKKQKTGTLLLPLSDSIDFLLTSI